MTIWMCVIVAMIREIVYPCTKFTTVTKASEHATGSALHAGATEINF